LEGAFGTHAGFVPADGGPVGTQVPGFHPASAIAAPSAAAPSKNCVGGYDPVDPLGMSGPNAPKLNSQFNTKTTGG